jgi:uncharacterized repeat protein (TIGR01451 family)
MLRLLSRRRSRAALAPALLTFALAACSGSQPGPSSLVVTPAALSFGTQKTGARTTATLTLSNQGQRALAISGSHVEGDPRAAFTAGTLPFALAAGASVTVEVAYSAAAEGDDAATLVIESDAANLPRATVALSGHTVVQCAAGLSDCTGVCVDEQQDGQNCGACAHACAADQRCDRGACACKPRSCGAGACGPIDDGCGGTLACGACAGQAECIASACVQPTCADGRKNGAETAVDCGGPTCPACGAGAACALQRDCDPLDCVSGGCGLAAPSGLNVSGAGPGKLAIAWVGTSHATTYSVLRSSDGGATFTEAGTTAEPVRAFTDAGLLDGKSYTYVVQALRGSAASARSAAASGLTAPAAPGGLVATVAAQTVTLAWQVSPGAAGYTVWRSDTSGSAYATLASTTGTTFGDGPLLPGAAFFYVVTAGNAGGYSPFSTEARAVTVLPAPEGLAVAQAGPGSLSLSWTGSQRVDFFTVERSIDGLAFAAAGAAAASPYTDTGLENGLSYTYRVRAENAVTVSAFSAPASGVTLLPAPAGVSVASAGPQHLKVTWSGANGATGYAVLRSGDGGLTFAAAGAALEPDRSFTDTGLADGQAYLYAVKATRGAVTSVASATASGTTVPAAPTGVTATAAASSVTVRWTAPAGATGFTVRRATTAGGPYTAAGSTGGVTLSDPGGFLPGARVFYVVSASNAGGAGPDSAEASVVVPLAAVALPVATASAKQIALSWGAVAGATSYLVSRTADGGATFAALGAVSATAYTDAALPNGARFGYAVQASSAQTTGPASATAFATTPLPAPARLAAHGGAGQASLDWDAVEGAVGYRIYRSAASGSGGTFLAAAAGPTFTDKPLADGSRFFYTVTATTPAAESPASPEAAATTALQAPGGLAATGGLHQVTLSWSPVAAATKYYLFRNSPGPRTLALTVDAPATSGSDTGLANGTAFIYEVQAANAVATSASTLPVGATTDMPAPSTVAAAGGLQSITVSWSAVPDAVGYQVFRAATAGGAYVLLGGAAGTSYTDGGLQNGATWSYQVRALGNDATSPSSAAATATTRRPDPDPLHTTFSAPLPSAIADGVHTVSLLVTVHDGDDLPVQGAAVALAADGTGNTFSAPATTDAAGQLSATLRSTTAQAKTVTATVAGRFSLTAAVTFVAGAPAKVVFTRQPSGVVAGAVMSPAVQVSVLDAQNNLTSYAQTVTLAAAGQTVFGATATASAGVATFDAVSLRKAGALTLTASAAGFTSAASSAFTVSAAPFSTLVFSRGPVDVVAGVALSPAVQVSLRDPFDNQATANNTVTLTAGAAVLGSASAAAVQGVATFGLLTVQTAGTFQLTATTNGASGPLSSGPSAAFTVSPASPAQVVFAQQPSAITAGATMSPAVQIAVLDAFNNRSTYAGPVTLSTGFGATSNASAGLAIFPSFTIRAAGSYRLSATAGALLSAQSNLLVVSPAEPTHLTLTQGPSSGTAGFPLAPAVVAEVRDAFENRVPQALHVTLSAQGAALGNAAVDAVSGLATFPDLTSTTAGTLQVVATSGALASAPGAPFTVAPGQPGLLVFGQQPGAGVKGQPLAPPVQVRVLDDFGNLTPSTATVQLAVPGATLTGGSAAAVAGVAAFPSLAVQPAGTFTATATLGALSSAASAPFTIVDVAPSGLRYPVNPAVYTKGVAIASNVPSSNAGGETGFAISPALPAGLSFDGNTGVISGTPTATSPATSYTVTAQNSGGATSVTLFITVNDAPPSLLAYPASPAVYTKGVAIAPAGPASSGGAVASYSISPSLAGTGLAFDTSTGVLSGTPAILAPQTAYTVTAVNTGGSASAVLLLTLVDVAPSAVAYPVNPLVATMGQAIAADKPTSAGGPVTSWTLAGQLPAGLSFDRSTGAITGTPTALAPANSYTVTAANSGGAASASLTITVNDVAPSALAYPVNPAVYTKGQVIASSAPASSGGAVVSYAVSPALPAGLSLDPATGVLSGTPAALAAQQGYLVTATNTGGSTSATLVLTVNDAAPAGLAYVPGVLACTINAACALGPPTTASGGAVVAFAIAPALPAGLSLDPATGIIQGAPVTLSPSAIYTVTASNSGGATSATITVTVNDVAPTALSYNPAALACTKGVACSLGPPTNLGGGIPSYSIAPALPAGLALNPASGVIAGTASALSPTAVYTVTATTSGGSTTATVSVAVNDVPPSGLAYPSNPAVYTLGIPASSAPTLGGGPVTSWSVTPALPAGLSLHPATGTISGTPQALSPGATYKITAANSGGAATLNLSISVVDVPPAALSYATNPAVYTLGQIIPANAASASGGPVTSWSISAAFASTGLQFDATSGAISGTPLSLSTATGYTVTASNSGGAASVTLTVTVVDRPPAGITYSPASLSCTVGVACSLGAPTTTGGAVVTWSVTPALPPGLALSATTGGISGTATALSPGAVYTVKAVNSGGSATASVTVSVADVAPLSLAYSPATLVCTKGTACALGPPASTGGAIVSYTVSPALPAGLALDPTTGRISGVPGVVRAAALYTVTATNSGGSIGAGVTLTVNDTPPAGLAYSPPALTCTKGSPCSLGPPTSSGGAITGFSIAPALPAGLSIDASGVLTGTPGALAAAQAYTVTATNSGGTTTASVSVTVKDVAPSGLAYSPAALVCTRGVACSLGPPSSGGGAVVSYSVSPTLPPGLALAPGSGVVSGAPLALSNATAYTVTATNTGGSSSAQISVTVNDQAPASLAYSNNPALFAAGTAIASDTPSLSGGTPTSWTVAPALPAGLSLNPSTGLITGTPAAAAASAAFTVTATNSGGAAQVSLRLAINPAPGPALADVAALVGGGTLYKLNGSDGTLRWGPVARTSDGALAIDPVDQGVYTALGAHLTGGDATTYKYDSNGALAWSKPFTQATSGGCGGFYGCSAGLAVDTTSAVPGVVCGGADCDGYLVKVARADGAKLWGAATAALGGPAVDPSSGAVYAFDAAHANLVYTATSDGAVGSAALTQFAGNGARPALNPADGNLYYAGGAMLYAVNKGNPGGAPLWSLDLSGSLTSVAALGVQPYAGGLLYLADSGAAKVLVVDPATHAVKASFPTAVAATSLEVGPYGGNVYLASSAARFVYAYSQTGAAVWTSPDLGGNVTSLAAVRGTPGAPVAAAPTCSTTSWTVTAPGFEFDFSGVAGANPVITVCRGQTFTFHLSNVPSFHPFCIWNGNSNTDAPGVTNNCASGTTDITWAVPAVLPDGAQYKCSLHFFGNTFVVQ